MYQAKQDNNILFTSGFDGNGQRVHKTRNEKTTLYLRDFRGRLLSEINSSDTFYTDYIYLNDKMIAKVMKVNPVSDADRILVLEASYQISEVSRNLGIHANLLGRWKRNYGDGGKGSNSDRESNIDMRAELNRLRKKTNV